MAVIACIIGTTYIVLSPGPMYDHGKAIQAGTTCQILTEFSCDMDLYVDKGIGVLKRAIR